MGYLYRLITLPTVSHRSSKSGLSSLNPSLFLKIDLIIVAQTSHSFTMKPLKIAVIPGDGIGVEVMPHGVRCLQAVAKVYDVPLLFESFDFASCDYFDKHGDMLPADWKQTLLRFDAIYFGAVGMPDRIPDDVTLWGSLLKFRREFDQYINLRPCRLMPGVPCPLAGRKPGDIDF